MATKPPMDPDTSEADAKQLELAREQGAAYRRALEHMATEVAEVNGCRFTELVETTFEDVKIELDA